MFMLSRITRAIGFTRSSAGLLLVADELAGTSMVGSLADLSR